MGMQFVVHTEGQGANGRHRTESTEFWSGEQRMGGAKDKPNPLELLLASLTGCMNVVLQMVAQEKGWSGVSGHFEASGEIDPRGLMGDPIIPPYFQTIHLTVRLTGVPENAVDAVRQDVGRRCPVHRLFEHARIPIHETWSTHPTA